MERKGSTKGKFISLVDKKKYNNVHTFFYELLALDYYRDSLTKQDKIAVEFIPREEEIFVLAYNKVGNSQKTIDISIEFDAIDKLCLGRAIAILHGFKFKLTKPQADGVHFAFEEYCKILEKLR